MQSKTLNLIAASSSICPTQPDWEPRQQLCGFFNVPEHGEQWLMPDGLRRFINRGAPPVYMTFGSMLSYNVFLQETAQLMVDAVRLTGCRAIVQSHWEMITNLPEHSDIYRISRAPHRHIFPQCVAVVRHGGAGTTQAAMRSGCPSVVVEHLGDQQFWGRELRRLGIASRLLHRRSITAKKLAREIRTVLDSSEMKDRAEKIGKIMRSEDGVGRAVELIENLDSTRTNEPAFLSN